MTEAVAVLIGAALGALASSGTAYTVERARERRTNRVHEAEHARLALIARRLVRQELHTLRHRAPWDSERWKLPTPAWDAWGALLAAELPEDLFEPIASAYISLTGGAWWTPLPTTLIER
jgi:hypothetical protein